MLNISCYGAKSLKSGTNERALNEKQRRSDVKALNATISVCVCVCVCVCVDRMCSAVVELP